LAQVVRNFVSFVGAAIATAALTDLIVANQELEAVTLNADLLDRLTTAAGIAAGCGSMALLVLARMSHGVDLEKPASEFDQMNVACPRCQKRQQIALGASSCAGCGLLIAIRVEEPRSTDGPSSTGV